MKILKKNIPVMNIIGGTLLIVAVTFSLLRVQKIDSSNKTDKNTKVIRLVHWQLELGLRETLDDIIHQYEAIYASNHNDKVKIIQLSIPERAYQQWVTTRIIGNDAPDIIELHAMDQYLPRYFVPFTEFVVQSNPYNKGTALEGVPWRETYIDNLENSFDEVLMEYYYIPMSIFTKRVFYNKSIFKKIMGSDKPPETFQQFCDICDEIKDYSEKFNLKISPVAGSDYVVAINNFMRENISLMAANLSDVMDIDKDGIIIHDEAFLSLAQDKWQFDDENIHAAFAFMKKISSYLTPGFMALKRDDAAFAFIRGQAAMIISGAWDARGFFEQSNFDVGVFKLPIPTKDNAEFGDFVDGQPYEDVTPQIQFGLTKQCKNKDIAIDFLRFLTSIENNQKLNRAVCWVPVIRGAKPNDRLESFNPVIEGYVTVLPYKFYNGTGAIGTSLRRYFSMFIIGEISFDEFAEKISADIKKELPGEFNLYFKSLERDVMRADGDMFIYRSKRLFPENIDISLKTADQKFKILIERQVKKQSRCSWFKYLWEKADENNMKK